VAWEFRIAVDDFASRDFEERELYSKFPTISAFQIGDRFSATPSTDIAVLKSHL
jgi:hypothetical protein